jgi:hypothetical protein
MTEFFKGFLCGAIAMGLAINGLGCMNKIPAVARYQQTAKAKCLHQERLCFPDGVCTGWNWQHIDPKWAEQMNAKVEVKEPEDPRVCDPPAFPSDPKKWPD